VIKQIIFDLGGVIVPDAFKIIRQEIAYHLSIDSEHLSDRIKDLDGKARLGEISLFQLYQETLKRLGRNYDDPKDLLDFHLQLYKIHSTKRDSEAVGLVRKLRKEGYGLFFLTNTELEITEFNKGKGLFELFDKGYFSTEMHMKKPDPKIYRAVLSDLGEKPRETIFIDDDIENINGALRAFKTINTLKYENVQQCRMGLRGYGVKV